MPLFVSPVVTLGAALACAKPPHPTSLSSEGVGEAEERIAIQANVKITLFSSPFFKDFPNATLITCHTAPGNPAARKGPRANDPLRAFPSSVLETVYVKGQGSQINL
jgi:hypothetical protein